MPSAASRRSGQLVRGAFANTHPAVGMSFFTFAVLSTVLFMHPVTLGVSFFCALAYSVRLNGVRALRFTLVGLLPMMAAAVAVNVLFTHRGETILFYLLDDNPFTLESLLYGLAASAMLGTVMLWFSCYNAVMTSDKFLYLFSRVIPALALVISMALRLVPRYKAQITKIAEAQSALGLGISTGNALQRARNGLTILSVMVTWALENGVETADSMHARGYGLPGRSSYAIYRMDGRDRLLLASLAYLAAVFVATVAMGHMHVRFYNSFEMNGLGPASALSYAAYALACSLPLAIDGYEALIWRSLRSSI
jgi:energy-coupling factor transport system permease protein